MVIMIQEHLQTVVPVTINVPPVQGPLPPVPHVETPQKDNFLPAGVKTDTTMTVTVVVKNVTINAKPVKPQLRTA